MDTSLEFSINCKLDNGFGRTGTLKTPHGTIKTPAFIVGGTNATVKTLDVEQVKALGGQSVLVNAYHLMLRPGADLIHAAGGVHKFMNWNKPIFSDSGGFQAFSLGMAYNKGIHELSDSKDGHIQAKHSNNQLAKVSDEGVNFKSHLDGSYIFLNPEKSMQIQHLIGADIHMSFDELTSPLAKREYIEKAMERTHRWADRCLERHKELNREHVIKKEDQQALYGVVQGARELDFRVRSAEFLGSRDFDGYGVGGVFESKEIVNILSRVNKILPDYKPRHLLGMGAQPADLFLGVEYGMDTFDCVAPTRQARNGALFTYDGRINIKNSKYRDDFSPIDKECDCYVCRNFSKAYLRHLFMAHEVLGLTLASIHNEHFVVATVDKIRESIENGAFFDYKDTFLNRYYR